MAMAFLSGLTSSLVHLDITLVRHGFTLGPRARSCQDGITWQRSASCLPSSLRAFTQTRACFSFHYDACSLSLTLTRVYWLSL